MCERIEDIACGARELVRALDTSSLPAEGALRLVDVFSELERLAAAGRTLAAERVQQTGAWRHTGSSSAVAWMADRAGTTFGQAAATLETAASLSTLPATREALVAGRLSALQVAEVSSAATADPSMESTLITLAERESVSALRERCRNVRAAVAGDEDATERIRRSRYFHHWSESDGSVRLNGRLAPDDAAPLLAVVDARADALAKEAGRREKIEAYAADAVCSLVDGAGAPKAVVHVHVSATALERGHTVSGETSRIEGVGPVAVGAARRMLMDGAVRVIESDGVDVRRVSHPGRVIHARLRSALEARDPSCVVPGCNRRRGLEIDHVVPLARGGQTELANLARLCRWHHSQKTHHSWELSGRPGEWTWRQRRSARTGPAP